MTIITDNPDTEIAPEHYMSGACDIMKAHNSGTAADSKGANNLRRFEPESRVVGGKHCANCDTVGKGKKFDVTHAGHVVQRQTIGQKYKNGRLTQDFHKLNLTNFVHKEIRKNNGS
jgi:hypothetical protein